MDSGDDCTVTVKHPGEKQSPTLKNPNKTHATESGGTILQTQLLGEFVFIATSLGQNM